MAQRVSNPAADDAKWKSQQGVVFAFGVLVFPLLIVGIIALVREVSAVREWWKVPEWLDDLCDVDDEKTKPKPKPVPTDTRGCTPAQKAEEDRLIKSLDLCLADMAAGLDPATEIGINLKKAEEELKKAAKVNASLADLAACRAKADKANADIKQADANLATATKDNAAIKKDLTAAINANAKLGISSGELQQNQKEVNETNTELTQAENQVTAAASQLTTAIQRIDALNAKLATAQQRAPILASLITDINQATNEADTAKAQLNNEINLLRKQQGNVEPGIWSGQTFGIADVCAKPYHDCGYASIQGSNAGSSSADETLQKFFAAGSTLQPTPWPSDPSSSNPADLITVHSTLNLVPSTYSVAGGSPQCAAAFPFAMYRAVPANTNFDFSIDFVTYRADPALNATPVVFLSNTQTANPKFNFESNNPSDNQQSQYITAGVAMRPGKVWAFSSNAQDTDGGDSRTLPLAYSVESANVGAIDTNRNMQGLVPVKQPAPVTVRITRTMAGSGPADITAIVTDKSSGKQLINSYIAGPKITNNSTPGGSAQTTQNGELFLAVGMVIDYGTFPTPCANADVGTSVWNQMSFSD